jgi:hypothetical protein
MCPDFRNNYQHNNGDYSSLMEEEESNLDPSEHNESAHDMLMGSADEITEQSKKKPVATQGQTLSLLQRRNMSKLYKKADESLLESTDTSVDSAAIGKCTGT